MDQSGFFVLVSPFLRRRLHDTGQLEAQDLILGLEVLDVPGQRPISGGVAAWRRGGGQKQQGVEGGLHRGYNPKPLLRWKKTPYLTPAAGPEAWPSGPQTAATRRRASSHPRSIDPMTSIVPRTGALSLFLLLGGAFGGPLASAADPPAVPAETPAEAAHRHEIVAGRRKGMVVICHRGASEHAHENTLEAFRATFELGGDGNEFDIRKTKDGVLVVFHDDMLDHLLEAYGDVSDYSWEELQRFRFRDPGRFGEQCRIPTLVEVFDLHRKYGGLIHLDIKRPGQDEAIADLLTRMDMWDHVAFCNDNADVILRDPRLKLLRYKGPGLYADHAEIFPDAIAAVLKRPGDGVIVDDPRARPSRSAGSSASCPRSPWRRNRRRRARRTRRPPRRN